MHVTQKHAHGALTRGCEAVWDNGMRKRCKMRVHAKPILAIPPAECNPCLQAPSRLDHAWLGYGR